MKLISTYLDRMLLASGVDLWENDNNYHISQQKDILNSIFDSLDVPVSNAHSSVLNTTQNQNAKLWN